MLSRVCGVRPFSSDRYRRPGFLMRGFLKFHHQLIRWTGIKRSKTQALAPLSTFMRKKQSCGPSRISSPGKVGLPLH
jgi:hypothetical protein